MLETDLLVVQDSVFSNNYLHNGAAVGLVEKSTLGYTGTPASTQVEILSTSFTANTGNFQGALKLLNVPWLKARVYNCSFV